MAKPRKRGSNWQLQVRFQDKRLTFSLGTIDQSESLIVAGHIQRILEAKTENVEIPASTLNWYRSASVRIKATFQNAGLEILPDGVTAAQLVESFMEQYSKKRIAERTRVRMRQSSDNITDHFGNMAITAIKDRDAQEFFDMIKEKYPAESTWTKILQRCKQIFTWAIDQDLIQRNPLRNLKGGRYENENRQVYISSETVTQVLDAMPPGDLKVITALARFAGLRIPSELAKLTWDRINFPKRTMVIWDQKRKRDRTTPIFPELHEILEQQFNRYGAGSSFVIQDEGKRDENANLRKSLNSYIIRSGNATWTKPFQNLRASCETDLLNRFPIHQVVKWIGNSTAVALRHYAMVSDADIAAAAAQPFSSRCKSAANENGSENLKDRQETSETLKNPQ